MCFQFYINYTDINELESGCRTINSITCSTKKQFCYSHYTLPHQISHCVNVNVLSFLSLLVFLSFGFRFFFFFGCNELHCFNIATRTVHN